MSNQNKFSPIYQSDQDPLYSVDPEKEAEIEQLIQGGPPPDPIIPEDEVEGFEDIGQSTGGVTWTRPCSPNVAAGAIATAYLSFDRTITGLEASDIEIYGHFNTNETSYWDITVSGSSTTSTSQRITVTASATEYIGFPNHNFRLKANSIRSGGSSTDNFPSSNVDSHRFTAYNYPYFHSTCASGDNIVSTLQFRFPFDTTVSLSDFRIESWRVANPNSPLQSICRPDAGWSISLSRTTVSSISCTCSNAKRIIVTANPTDEKGGRDTYYTITFVMSNVSLGTRYPSGFANTVSVRPSVRVDNWPYFYQNMGGTTLSARFFFRYPFAVTGIDSSDFRVLQSDSRNRSGAVSSGWAISVNRSSVIAKGCSPFTSRYVIVTATPPDDVWAYFKLDVRHQSMRKGSSTSNTLPKTFGIGTGVIVNNSPYWSNVRGGATLTATLNFRGSQTISNIIASAFRVNEWRGTSPYGVLGTWTITVSPSTISGGSGTVSFSAIPPILDLNATFGPVLTWLALNRGTGTRNSPSTTIRFSGWSAVVDTRPSWTNLTGGTTLTGRLNFKYSRAISDIKSDAFKVQNSTGQDQSGWNVTSTPASLTGNGYITVTATPPTDTIGVFRLVVNSLSAKAGTTTTHNVPLRSYASGSVNINNRPATPPPGTPIAIATVSWSNMTGLTGIYGRLTFSGASVTGISSTDFEVIDSAGNTQSWTITPSASSASSGSYITVNTNAPRNLSGQYRLRIKRNSISSGGGTNNAPTSAVTSPAVTVNTLPAVINPWWTNVMGGTTLSATLNFNSSQINIDSITESDFEVLTTNSIILDTWTFSLDKSQLTYDATMVVTANPPSGTDANFYLRMKATSYRSGGSPTDNAPSRAIRTDDFAAVDNSVATVATARWDRVTGGRDLDGRITFGLAEVIGISRSDFQVLSSGGVIQTGWDIDVSAHNTNESDRINVYTDPPRNTNGSFKLRLKALSVRSGGIKQPKPDNAPANNVDSPVQVVNNTGNLGTISWTSIEGGSTLEGVLTFTGAAVDRVRSSSIRVKNRSDQLQSGWDIQVSSDDAPAGGSITITATPPSRTQNWFYLELRRRSLRSGGSTRFNAPLNDISTEAEFVDNIVPRPGRVSWIDVTGGTRLVGRLRFRGRRVYGMQPQDFTVVNEFEQELTTWQITVSHWARNAGQVGTITALPPASTNGRFKLRLKEISVRSGPTSTDNAPPENVDSSFTNVNNGGVAIATPSWSSVIGGTAITGTLTFTGASVTGISRSDFQVLNTSNQVQSRWSISVSSSSASNGGSVTVTASPPRTLTGSFKLRLKLNSIQSGTNSRNVPSANLDSNSVAIDNTPIPVVAEADWSNVSGGTLLSARLTFENAAITNLDDTDIDVYEFGTRHDDWTIHVFRSTLEQGQFGIIAATPPENTSGWFRFRLNALSVRSDGSATDNAPSSFVQSAIAFVDNRPIIIARAEWRNVSGGSIIVGRIYFYDTTVRSISRSSFRVHDSLGRTVNWRIDISRSYASDGGFVIVWGTPPANTRGAYRLALLASSVRSGTSRTSNAPASTVLSPYAIVDNRPKVVATAAWTGERGGTTLSATLTFSGTSVGGIERTDFEVLDLHNRVVSGWSISVNRNIVFAGTPITVTASPPPNTNQSFRLRLKATSVMSGGSRSNNAPSSAVISIARAVRNVAQLASSTWTNIAGGTTLRGTMTFRLARVTEINSTDFSVVNLSNVVQSRWTIGIAINTFSTSVVVNVTATPPAGTNGSFKLQLNALSVRSETSNDTPVQNVISPVAAPINNVPTYLIATASWSEESGGTAFTAELTFDGADVTNIGPLDFEVYTATGTRQYGWGILVEASSLSDGESITIAAAPPRNTRGSFKVRLKQLSVRSGGLPITENPNAPVSNIDSDPVTVDNIVTVTVESFTAPEGVQRGSTSTFRLAFNTDILVSALTATDMRAGFGNYTISAINAIDPINGAADEFDIVVDNPADTRGVYSVVLFPNTIPGTEDYEQGPPSPGAASLFITFDTRVFGGNWFNTTYDSTRNRLLGQIVFSHEVQHLSNSDFEVVERDSDGNETVRSWTISYTINANPARAANIFATVPANTNGSFALRLKRLSLRYDGESELNGPQSAIISPYVSIDNRTYSIATMRWTLEMGGSSISGRLTFTDATVTGVETSDFEIIDEDDNVYPSNLWPITINENTGPPHYVTVNGTPNALQNIKGSYRINLKADSLFSGGSPDENAPVDDLPSAEVIINTLPRVSVTSFTTESGIIRRTTANFELTFNVPILRDELTPADFIGGNVATVGSLVAGDRSRIFKITARNPSNGVGSYRLVLRRNAIPDGTSYNEGPSAAAESDLVRYNTRASTVTGSWGTVSTPDSNRSVTSTLTFTGNPGATFNIAEDIVIQIRILTLWQDRPIIWSIAAEGSTSPTSKPMRATPSASVAAGTYRFLLKGGALGVGSAAAHSDPFTIGEPPEVPTAVIVEAESRFLIS